jgi:hypothetical protein
MRFESRCHFEEAFFLASLDSEQVSSPYFGAPTKRFQVCARTGAAFVARDGEGGAS